MQNKKKHIDYLEELIRVSALRKDLKKETDGHLREHIMDKMETDHIPGKNSYQQFKKHVKPSNGKLSALYKTRVIIPLALLGLIGFGVYLSKYSEKENVNKEIQITTQDNKAITEIYDIPQQIENQFPNPDISENEKSITSIKSKNPTEKVSLEPKIKSEFVSKEEKKKRIEITDNLISEPDPKKEDLLQDTEPVKKVEDNKPDDIFMNKNSVLRSRVSMAGKHKYVVFFKENSEELKPGAFSVMENLLDEIDSERVSRIKISFNIKKRFLFFTNKKLVEQRKREFKREIRQSITKESKHAPKIIYGNDKTIKLNQKKYRDDYMLIEVIFKK